jgi:hypothetical protein
MPINQLPRVVFLGRGIFSYPMSNIALSFEDTGWVAKKAPSQKDYP